MRYLSHTTEDIKTMLNSIGRGSISELFESIPEELRFDGELDIPKALTEWQLEEYLNRLSSKGFTGKSYLGAGSYNHHIPNIIGYLTSRSEFLTSYTPYQPEISQGTLQALFEYQTYISEYLGMDYSNASMYDGATSFVEAVLLAVRSTKRDKVLVSKAINPNYLEVLKTYADTVGLKVILLDYDINGKTILDNLPNMTDIASISVQSPNFFGVIEDQELIKPIIGSEKTLFISVFSEILSFGLFNPPGYYGADIACGEGQSFGISRSYGGPALGVFAFNQKYLRTAPGRLVGETTDKKGRRSFSLTLATREQHIRREKATSNICSNQGLCVLSATIYLSLLGGHGLKKLALLNYNNAEYLKKRLVDIGCQIQNKEDTFNEFVVTFSSKIDVEELEKFGIIPGFNLTNYNMPENTFLVTVTEVFNKVDLDDYVIRVGGYRDI